MTGSWRARIGALALWLCAAMPALAQNSIQAINSTQQAGVEVIRIELAEPLTAVPNGFAVQTPPRVAIDLPGVTNALGKSSVEINQGNLRSINVAQSGDRTRLVMNLKTAANYRAELQGKVLLIVLESAARAGTAAAPAPTTAEPVQHFAENLNRSQVALQAIDFRRGADGAGR
ncbi:MAG TPA: AMIN domain-containing protein, partial [Albitalea sp.]|nr:AMIN domain-containing protein [Albitalea sp.]